MASKRKPFTFYDTFNDTFDSNRGHLKISVPESLIINFTVLQAPEIDLDQHEVHARIKLSSFCQADVLSFAKTSSTFSFNNLENPDITYSNSQYENHSICKR